MSSFCISFLDKQIYIFFNFSRTILLHRLFQMNFILFCFQLFFHQIFGLKCTGRMRQINLFHSNSFISLFFVNPFHLKFFPLLIITFLVAFSSNLIYVFHLEGKYSPVKFFHAITRAVITGSADYETSPSNRSNIWKS